MSSEEFNTTQSETVVFKGVAIREPLFIDILVEDKVLVEVKATEKTTLFIKHRFFHIRLLSKLHLLAKIAIFGAFIAEFFSHIYKYGLKILLFNIQII